MSHVGRGGSCSICGHPERNSVDVRSHEPLTGRKISPVVEQGDRDMMAQIGYPELVRDGEVPFLCGPCREFWLRPLWIVDPTLRAGRADGAKVSA